MSNSNSEDNAFFEKWAATRKKALMHSISPRDATLQYLKKTTIPYAIIGGKAAIYHLITTGANSSLLALASSTNDYDLIVKSTYADRFIHDLQAYIRKKTAGTGLDQKTYDTPMVRIVLMGVQDRHMFTDIVDVHALKPQFDSHFPKNSVIGPDGLWYADKAWVCKELKFALKHHASYNDVSKSVKRQARHDLLEC